MMTTVLRRPLMAAAVGLVAVASLPHGASPVSAAPRSMTFAVAGSMTVGGTGTAIDFPAGATWRAIIDTDKGTIKDGRVSVPPFSMAVPIVDEVTIELRDAKLATGTIGADGQVTLKSSFEVVIAALGCKISPINIPFTTKASGGKKFDGKSATVVARGFTLPALRGTSLGGCPLASLANGLLGLPTSTDTAVTMTLTAIQKPSAPRNVFAVAGKGKVSLDWQAPKSNGGSAITGYRVQYRQGANGNWTNVRGVSGRSAVASRLAAGKTYVFRVGAINGAGVTWSKAVEVKVRR
jgi:hypothetical protein